MDVTALNEKESNENNLDLRIKLPKLETDKTIGTGTPRIGDVKTNTNLKSHLYNINNIGLMPSLSESISNVNLRYILEKTQRTKTSEKLDSIYTRHKAPQIKERKMGRSRFKNRTNKGGMHGELSIILQYLIPTN